MEWVVLFIIIVILGALAGGNSFGGTVRKGCGCLVAIFVVMFVIAVLVASIEEA